MIIIRHITFLIKFISGDWWNTSHRYWQWQYNNTVGGSCYSSHQAVCKFSEHHIDMVSWVHRKWKTRAGVSLDINKRLECVTKTDSKFSNRVLVCMTPKSTSVNGVTIWRTIGFLPQSVQMRTFWPAYNHATAFCLLNCFLCCLQEPTYVITWYVLK